MVDSKPDSTSVESQSYGSLRISGGTIRRELDFQTRVPVLASTSIPIGNVGDGKKKQNHARRFEWTIIEILATMKE